MFGVFGIVLALLAMPVDSRTPAVSVADPVSGQVARFVRDLRAKDVADSMSLYADDAVFINPDGSRFVGKRAIRSLYELVAASFDSDITLQTGSHARTATRAVEAGTFHEGLRSRKTGNTLVYRGTYRFTLERDPRGRWLFTRVQWTLTS